MTTFSYDAEIFVNGAWEQLGAIVKPLLDSETLDESLDSGTIKISFSKRGELVPPFTPFRIMVQENGAETHYIYRHVSDSKITQRRFVEPYLYDHEFTTIELTKQLERDISDSLTFTNYLFRDYAEAASEVEPYGSVTEPTANFLVINGFIYSPVVQGYVINFPSPSVMVTTIDNVPGISYTIIASSLSIIKPDGTIDNVAIGNEPANYTFELSGETYSLRYYYYVQINASGNISLREYYLFYDIETSPYVAQKEQYTITAVLNRILSAGMTRRQGQQQKYALDPAIAEKYADVLAPEFYITRSTMFEALMAVGGYIHAIPRLVWDETTNTASIITFDELGGSVEKQITAPLEGYDAEIGIDEYCSELDSTVDNLLNSRDLIQGAITEPFTDGFVTPRCAEDEVQISNDTALIRSTFPIYRITKLEMTTDVSTVYDITAYVYEAAEYQTLSSYGGGFPNSKAYALTYAQGDNQITGLNFRITQASGAVPQNYALNNIYQRVSGSSANLTFKNVGFRITYIPIVNARVKQLKAYKDEQGRGALIYNQSANTVESEFYGENLKGTILRLGNEIEHRTYKFTRWSDIPKCGEIVDGKYVGMVEKEYERHWIKATTTLTKDFNKLAQYIAINSNFRLYDVSEKQSIDRIINYSDTVLIGDDENRQGHTLITDEGLLTFRNTFIQEQRWARDDNQASLMRMKGYNSDGSEIAEMLLPCVSMAQGNSMIFMTQYQDNFGAGYNSNYSDLSNGIDVQKLVPYGNVYGEIHSLGVVVAKNLGFFASDLQISQAAQGLGHSLPLPNDNRTSLTYFDTENLPFEIQKDSREALSFLLQMHFVANRKTIVFGSQLAQNCPMVNDTDALKKARLYYLGDRLNTLTSVVDLTNSGLIRDNLSPYLTYDYAQKKITFDLRAIPLTQFGTYKSWALIDTSEDPTGKTGKLYIGENVEFDATNDNRKNIVFNF